MVASAGHAVAYTLKNWTDRVGYYMASPWQPFGWNYFRLLTGRIVHSNKKRNLRKYSVVFFLKHFQKKKQVFDGPYRTDKKNTKRTRREKNLRKIEREWNHSVPPNVIHESSNIRNHSRGHSKTHQVSLFPFYSQRKKSIIMATYIRLTLIFDLFWNRCPINIQALALKP